VPAPSKFDLLLADFLKKRRDGRSFAEFGRETGLHPSSLFRLERGEQSLTVGKLYELMKRLNVSLEDVFGNSTRKKLTRRD
jgi:transcriptional regulator with XRE-family HTH domain